MYASYRVRPKVRTIDRWPARETLFDGALGEAQQALSYQGFTIIAVPLLFVHQPSASAPSPASAVAHVDTTIRMTTIVLLESSMRQFHKRHSICQTLITPVVPESSYRLCTVSLVLPNGESQRHVREFVNPRLGCLSFPAGPDDKNYSFSAFFIMPSLLLQ